MKPARSSKKATWVCSPTAKCRHKARPMQVAAQQDVQIDSTQRYLYDGSLNSTFQPLKGDVAFHAEGHAEFALAEAKAHGAVYFPSKEGWMWTLPASLVEEGAKAEDMDLGAIRLAVAMELAGVVGASIAAEGNLAVENKEGRFPVAKGRRPAKRGKRRTRAVQVFGPKKNMKVAELDFKLNAFAGAKAEAELKGAIEWRNPEHKDKAFVAFAATTPSIGGMAGIGGECDRQPVLGLESVMASDIVRRYANDHGAAGSEIGRGGGEIDRLDGAGFGIVGGIEIDNDGTALESGEADVAATIRHEIEVGRPVAFGQHRHVAFLLSRLTGL